MNRGHPILTFLLCAILLILILAASAVGILQHVVSEQAISNMISDMVSDIDAQTLVEELEIYDRLVELVDEEIVENLGITPEIISEFLDREPVREFVSDSVAEVINAFVHGEGILTISQEDIFQLVRDNVPYIEEEFGIVIDEQYIREVEELLERSEVPESISVDMTEIIDIEENIGVDLYSVRWLLMPSTSLWLIVASLVLIFIIFLINIRGFGTALIGVGITSALSGALILFVGTSLVTIIVAFAHNEFFQSLLNSLLSQFRETTNLVGTAQLITGVVLIIAFAVTKMIPRRG